MSVDRFVDIEVLRAVSFSFVVACRTWFIMLSARVWANDASPARKFSPGLHP